MTAETTGFVFIPQTSIDLQMKNDYFRDESGLGNPTKLIGGVIAKQWAEGKIEGKLDVDVIGYWIKALFGTDTPVTTLGATTHTFSVNNTVQLPLYTINVQRGTELGYIRTVGTGIKSLNIKAESGGEASYSADFIAIKQETGTTVSASYTQPTRYLIGRHVTAKSATTVAGLSGGTAFNVRSVEFNINRNTDVDWALGSVNPIDILAKEFETEIKFTATLSSANFQAQFGAGTKTAFEFAIENQAAGVLGTSTLYPKLTITSAPSLVDISYKFDNGDVVTFDATVNCEFSVSDSFEFRPVLQNITATY